MCAGARGTVGGCRRYRAPALAFWAWPQPPPRWEHFQTIEAHGPGFCPERDNQAALLPRKPPVATSGLDAATESKNGFPFCAASPGHRGRMPWLVTSPQTPSEVCAGSALRVRESTRRANAPVGAEALAEEGRDADAARGKVGRRCGRWPAHQPPRAMPATGG